MYNFIIDKVKKVPISFKSAIVYTFCVVFSKGISFITLPFFIRLMSVDQIGYVNLYNSWFSIISIFTTLSLTSGGFSIAMKDYKNERDSYISSILSLTTLLSLFIIIIYFFNVNFWNNLFGLDTKFMLLMFLGFILNPAKDFWLSRNRYEYKYKFSSFIIISSTILSTFLSILAIIFIKNDQAFYKILFSDLILYSVYIFIYIYIFIKGKKVFDISVWKYSLSLSLPLVGYSLASQILSVSDRIMIEKMIGLSALGIYGTIYSISSISNMLWSALNASFVPYLYQNIGKNNGKVKLYSFYLLLFYSLLSIIFVFFAPEIVRLFATKEYFQAIYLIPPTAAGIYFISVSNMYSNILIYNKKTKYIMISSIIAAIINIILNYIFISKYGYIAAAYTTLFSYFIMTVFVVYFVFYSSKKVNFNIKDIYSNKKIFILTVFTCLICLLAIFLYKNIIIRIIFIFSLILLFLFYFLRNRK